MSNVVIMPVMTLESLYYVTCKVLEKNSKFSKALIYLKPIEKKCVFFLHFIVIQFCIGLESVGHMTWELLTTRNI